MLLLLLLTNPFVSKLLPLLLLFSLSSFSLPFPTLSAFLLAGRVTH
jgi:hypothetical protein